MASWLQPRAGCTCAGVRCAVIDTSVQCCGILMGGTGGGAPHHTPDFPTTAAHHRGPTPGMQLAAAATPGTPFSPRTAARDPACPPADPVCCAVGHGGARRCHRGGRRWRAVESSRSWSPMSRWSWKGLPGEGACAPCARPALLRRCPGPKKTKPRAARHGSGIEALQAVRCTPGSCAAGGERAWCSSSPWARQRAGQVRALRAM